MTIEEERFRHQYIIAEMYLQLLLHLGKCSLLKFFYLKVLPIGFQFYSRAQRISLFFHFPY